MIKNIIKCLLFVWDWILNFLKGILLLFLFFYMMIVVIDLGCIMGLFGFLGKIVIGNLVNRLGVVNLIERKVIG